jgi:ppGpp synthetase/RelA/SpoT-type nucleotidyltranferase
MPELKPPRDKPDQPDQPPDEPDPARTTSADARWLARFATPDQPSSLDDRIDAALAEHPEVASVLKRLAADEAHPLNVTQALADPARSDATLATIAELADGRLLRDRSLAEYLADHPGTGPLFDPVPPEVNETADGTDRKTAYVDRSKTLDPARTVGPEPTDTQRSAVNQYAERLYSQVEPAVRAEVAALTAGMEGVRSSVRTKTGDDVFDKVQRMTAGSEGRPSRPDYRVGDVIDAVGARITVENTEQLGALLERVKDHYGVGDAGRILEIENMYAQPKPGNPAYRVIPLVVGIDVGGVPYTYELQLTTRRASIAADLEHNTMYKPYVPVSGEERGRVDAMFHEAAALEQEETEGRGDEFAR